MLQRCYGSRNDRAKDHVGGLIIIRPELWWHRSGWDNKYDRTFLLVDVAPPGVMDVEAMSYPVTTSKNGTKLTAGGSRLCVTVMHEGRLAIVAVMYDEINFIDGTAGPNQKSSKKMCPKQPK
jgi:hypothetical protein